MNEKKLNQPDALDEAIENTQVPESPPDDHDPFASLGYFLRGATNFGLSPLVAYSYGDQQPESEEQPEQDDFAYDEPTDDQPSAIETSKEGKSTQKVLILTTNIKNLSYALNILSRATSDGYNLGRRKWPNQIMRLHDENPHIFSIAEADIPGLSTHEAHHVGRFISRFGAPFLKEKGFALVDICGFSRLHHSDQLSALYSLTNLLDAATYRAKTFCDSYRTGSRFGRTSTGDGYYFWHEGLGNDSDAICLATLFCLMVRADQLRRSGFPLTLRASFFVGETFLFYDAAARRNTFLPASNAIGPATNGAARLISASMPGQILINDFTRRGYGYGRDAEVVTTTSLLSQANEIFRRAERSPAAKVEPTAGGRLRVVDKHTDVWYCYNLHGNVPASPGSTKLAPIGLEEDKSTNITEKSFIQLPRGRVI